MIEAFSLPLRVYAIGWTPFSAYVCEQHVAESADSLGTLSVIHIMDQPLLEQAVLYIPA